MATHAARAPLAAHAAQGALQRGVCFSNEELAAATGNWSDALHLDCSGGRAVFFRGTGLRDMPPATLVKRLGRGAGARRELETEIALARAVPRCPYLVLLLGTCGSGSASADACLCTVFPLFPNLTLSHWLPRHVAWLTAPLRVHAARRVSMALHALHALRWVHCSVSSASVLLSERRIALLGDTSYAQAAGAAAVFTRGKSGEPWHMDPEVMRTGQVQSTSDVYALGALLVELLCGRLAADTAGDACQKVRASRHAAWHGPSRVSGPH
jgi:serine/threonine protein kinase